MAANKKPTDAEILSQLHAVLEQAYKGRHITRTNSYDDVVFTVRIPHVKKGEGADLFKLAAEVMV